MCSLKETPWPPSKESLRCAERDLPSTLESFFSTVLKSKEHSLAVNHSNTLSFLQLGSRTWCNTEKSYNIKTFFNRH